MIGRVFHPRMIGKAGFSPTPLIGIPPLIGQLAFHARSWPSFPKRK
uniref:Uncharacterized protein n=1 Tax=Picea glauca TaxID=3330 RepID=A0A101LV03_PICGL|nr:hypothetical protein ABT39_MTgene2379 [Picea glauca]QHR92239.1 hypothetical protein Q903MT_gene6278 [Picea sitchensis]